MSISNKSNNIELDIKSHSFAHLMAAAVKIMFPDAQMGVGPVIENGCYYDFILPRTLIPEDLKLIENHIQTLLKEDLSFKYEEVSIEEALILFADQNQPLKIELITDLRDKGTTKLTEEERQVFGDKITVYRLVNDKTGEVLFTDLCKGPHVKSVRELRDLGYKLDKFSSAYWRGDQDRNISMQRLYCLVFNHKNELKEYLNFREESKKRDHRVLGEQLDLFTFSELIGKGLALWLPKGKAIQDVLEKWAHQEEKKQGYQPVSTPVITRESLFYTSGHLPLYKDSMFAGMKVDGENYYVKPMNCPFHHQIFAAKKRSYRELPLRFSEYGICNRYEDSGSLLGLMRVRGMKMNDAHIYCTEDQAVDEYVKSIELIKTYFEVLEIKDYWLELALRDPESSKYHDDEEMWAKAEELSKRACEKANIKYEIVNDGAAFYGPKIDIQMKSAIGKVYTSSTSQIDLYTPKQFDLKYIDDDGIEKTPIVIHRAPLSTHERMIGFLIEHFAGKFPFWLSPVQVKILTINDAVLPFVEKIKSVLDETILMKPLKYNEIRYEIDDRNETLGKKIRDAKIAKIPMLMIVGEKDVENQEVSIEYNGDSVKIKLEELNNYISKL